MRSTIGFLVALIAAATAASAAAQMTIDQSTTLDQTIEEDIEIVAGSNPPTIANVVAPASLRGHVRVYDNSELNFTGGVASGLIEAYDSSIVHYASDRYSSGLELSDSSMGTVAGGINGVATYGSSTVTMLEGAVAETWFAWGESVMVIYDGRTEFLLSHDDSEIRIFGGSFSPWARDASRIDIRGGTIDDLMAGDSTGEHTAVIRVFGSDFNYPYGPLPDEVGTLTGVLSSGESISAPFEIHSGASIVLAVPEPSSLILSAMAAGFAAFWACRRRRRR